MMWIFVVELKGIAGVSLNQLATRRLFRKSRIYSCHNDQIRNIKTKSTCQANSCYGQNTPEIPSWENWIMFHTFEKRQQQYTECGVSSSVLARSLKSSNAGTGP